MEKFIPLSVPNLKANELKYVSHAVETEWISMSGPDIPKFEQAFANYIKAESVVACQSGSSALHLALLEAGIKHGEGVITADLTFIASTNPIIYAGAIPFFIGCDDSLCIDPLAIKEFIENSCEHNQNGLFEKITGVKITAMLPVHIFGNLCDMQTIIEIAKQYNLVVIEDACEAVGSFWTSGKLKGRHAGTVGDFGAFSFNGNKIITTGGGGAVVANDQTKLEHIRYLSQQAKDDALRFIHNEVGYNYRMNNIQAALGVAQLEQLESFIKTKKQNYDRYLENGVELLPFKEDISPNYWFYSFNAEQKRDTVLEKLRQRKIDCRPVWALMHELPPFKDFVSFKTEKAEYYQQSIVNLPCSSNLSLEDVDYVSKNLKEILKEV